MNRTAYAAVGGAIGGALIVLALVYTAVLKIKAVDFPAPPCAGAECQIDVDVSGTPPDLTISPSVWTLRLSGGNPKVIHWHLKNNQYVFKDDSVMFYDSNFATQFGPGTGGNGPDFRVTDKNTSQSPSGGAWGYLLKVYDKSTGYWQAIDPWIKNG